MVKRIVIPLILFVFVLGAIAQQATNGRDYVHYVLNGRSYQATGFGSNGRDYQTSGGAPTITIVQHHITDHSGGATSISLTISSTGAGNLLVVAPGSSSSTSTTISSITDNAPGGSCTYTEATSARATSSSALNVTDIYYCLSSKSGATSVTVNYSASVTYQVVEVWEVHLSSGSWKFASGANTSNATGSGTTLTGPTMSAVSPYVNFMAALAIPNTAINQNPLSGNAFTSGGDLSAGASGAVSLITSASGNYTPQWKDSASSDPFCASGAVFGPQ